MKNISDKYNNIHTLDEFDNNEELSYLETHVLANKVERKILESSYNSDLARNLRALGRYIFDMDVKWYKKSLVIATLAYFVKPKDVLTHWNDFFDFLDEVGVIEWTVRFLGKEIEKYY
jgi:uncharacterized membrane protein YkvA (DUF1232 family)